MSELHLRHLFIAMRRDATDSRSIAWCAFSDVATAMLRDWLAENTSLTRLWHVSCRVMVVMNTSMASAFLFDWCLPQSRFSMLFMHTNCTFLSRDSISYDVWDEDDDLKCALEGLKRNTTLTTLK